MTAKYPYVKTDLKIANIIAGQNAFAWDMINSSYLPRLVIVAFVESSALTGSFDLKRLSDLVNGVSTPGAPIHANFDVSGSHGAATMENFDFTMQGNETVFWAE